MAVLGNTTAPNVTLANPASAAHHAVRKEEFDAAITSVSSGQSTLDAGDVALIVEGLQVDTWSIQWVPGSGLCANVRLAAQGNIYVGVNGLYASGLSPLGHTHSQLHDPVTVVDGNSIDFTLAGQQLTGEVKLDVNPGLEIAAGGLRAFFGSGQNDVARGNHSHALLHSPVTLQSTSTVTLSIGASPQMIRADVKLDADPPGARILNTSAGLYVPTNNSSGAAAYNHTHANATQGADGFMSASDKVKLDTVTVLLQLETPSLYPRHDFLAEGEYVGGKKRWNQRMQVTRVNLTALAPILPQLLQLEVAGALTGETIYIPSGVDQTEVTNEVTLTNRFIETGEYARWKCVSGIPASSGIENAASMIHVEMNVQAAVASAPVVRVNAGGSAATPFAADAYFDTGASTLTVINAINVSAVSNPAPQAVYQSARAKLNDSVALNYTIPGLAKGIDYTVRLHFAELRFTASLSQLMKLEVMGATTQTLNSYDIFGVAGARYKADIREFTVRADAAGQIRVRVTPLLTSGGQHHLSINGIEIVPA